MAQGQAYDSGIRSIQASDSFSIDAFANWKVAEVKTQLDNKAIIDKLPLFVDEYVNGGAIASTQSGAEVTMSTTGTGQTIIRQTKQTAIYQSAKSPEIWNTMRNFQTVTNGEKVWGYYCASNTVAPYTSNKDGILMRSTGTTIFCETYNQGTATSSFQRSEWYDPLDGTGVSGINHNFDNPTIVYIDYEWLGYGRVRFFLVSRGAAIPFHQVDFTNGGAKLDASGIWTPFSVPVTIPYMETPNHPLRWELTQSGAGSNDFVVTCSTVGTRGDVDIVGTNTAFGTGTTTIALQTTGQEYLALAYRKQNTKARTRIDNKKLSFLSASNDNLYWRLCLNPTLGSTPTYTPLTDSSIETAIGGTTNGTAITVSGGYTLDYGFVKSGEADASTVENALKAGVNIDGTADQIVLAVTPISSNATVLCSLSLNEIL